MRRILILTCGVLAASLSIAQGAPKPQGPRNGLLEKVFERGATNTYYGERVVTIRRRDKVQSYREMISKKGENIKIKFFGESDDINGQIVVENGRMRWHYIPKRNEIRESPARREESLMFLIGTMLGGRPGQSEGQGPREGDDDRRRDEREPRPHPSHKESDGGFVAGHRTRLVAITDGKRDMVKLWIEPANAVILKREAFGPRGERLGGYEFQTINFKPSFPSNTFTPPAVKGAKRVTVEDLLRSEAKKHSMKPYRLVGDKEYKLLSARGFEQDKSQILVLVYTNGRNRITLFQVKGSFDPKRFNREADGRFTTWTWSADGVNFALVGSLELDKLKALAKKVRA